MKSIGDPITVTVTYDRFREMQDRGAKAARFGLTQDTEHIDAVMAAKYRSDNLEFGTYRSNRCVYLSRHGIIVGGVFVSDMSCEVKGFLDQCEKLWFGKNEMPHEDSKV